MISVTSPTKCVTITDDELPDGWAASTLGEICQVNPTRPRRDEVAADAEVTFVPMPAVDADSGTIATPQIRGFDEVRKGFTAFRDNDVIMAKITPCMENGKAAIAKGLRNGLGFGSTEFHVFRSRGAVLPEYVYYFIRQESFRSAAEMEMTGSVGQKRVPADFVESAEIPIPPLVEQKRIVETIAQLTARTDTARRQLAKVPTILKRFRQAVLAAACSGQLTAEWREQHGTERPSEDEELPASWERRTLRDLCEGFEYGSSQKSDDKGDVPVLRMGNLQDGKIDWTNLKYSSDPGEITKYSLSPNTVLFNRTNSPELVGKTAIYRGERPAIFAGYLIRIAHGRRLEPEFLNYCLNEPGFREYCMQVKSDGVSQSNINAKKLAGSELALPPLIEQREIIRRVEALMKLADAIEQRVAIASARADKTTQAILAKAFRGELVPTEADLARAEGREYEPADILLARIQSTNHSAPTRHDRANGRARRRPTR